MRKVIIEFLVEGKKEYEFYTIEAMQDFIDECIEIQTMQGGIKEITIIY